MKGPTLTVKERISMILCFHTSIKYCILCNACKLIECQFYSQMSRSSHAISSLLEKNRYHTFLQEIIFSCCAATFHICVYFLFLGRGVEKQTAKGLQRENIHWYSLFCIQEVRQGACTEKCFIWKSHLLVFSLCALLESDQKKGLPCYPVGAVRHCAQGLFFIQKL